MSGILLGLAGWLAVSVVVTGAWVLAMHRRRYPLDEATRRRRRVMAAQGLTLAGSVAVAAAVSPSGDWEPHELVAVLAAFALASDAVPVPVGRFRFSGGFVGIVLAMALLGPAPAVFIGILCAVVDGLRVRPPRPYLLNNLASYASFPLAGGVVLGALADAPPALFAVAVGVVAVLANLLNFVLVAGHAAALDPTRDALAPAIRRTWLPMVPWELATAVVIAIAVYGYATAGAAVVAACAVGLLALQALLVLARDVPRFQPPPRVG